MAQIQFDAIIDDDASDAEDISWTCSVCGRARLCPYAAPCLSDAREACRSCGDLLAQLDPRAMVPRYGLNLEVM